MATKVADAAVRHFDGIDFLVNSAGIHIPKLFTEYMPEDFELRPLDVVLHFSAGTADAPDRKAG